MNNQFDFKIHIGLHEQFNYLNIVFYKKSAVKIIIRSLKGAIVFKLIEIYEIGEHRIKLNNNHINEDVYFVFFEINQEVFIKKIEIQ